MNVKLVSLTKSAIEVNDEELSAEQLISYCARVSSPNNQNNLESAPKLLRYLIKHKHWSPFEMVSLSVEIQTSRAIATQILRHKSLCFQEYSQRYSKSATLELYNARRQDTTNRQNSLDDLSCQDKQWFLDTQQDIWNNSFAKYEEALSRGISKESARFILPLNTSTTLIASGTIRSWIHYLEIRGSLETQLEHREIAQAIINKIFIPNFPSISEALGWHKGATNGSI